MYCPKCGREIPDSSEFCPHCGKPQMGKPAPEGGKGLAIASLVLALVGLGTAAIVTGVISLVEKRPGRGMALAGVIIAASRTGIALLAVFAIAWLAFFGVFIAAAEEKSNDVSELFLPDINEECEEPWCLPSGDSELNVDTSWANQSAEFIEQKEEEIDELDARVEKLEEEDSGSDEVAEALLVAGYHIRRAKSALRDLEQATGSLERVELMGVVEQHVYSARAGLDSAVTEDEPTE